MSQQLTHTVGSLLDDMARRYPDNEALVYPERGLALHLQTVQRHLPPDRQRAAAARHQKRG